MRRKRKAAVLLAALLAFAALAGCGLWNDVSNTVGYVNDANAYIQETTDFVANASTLAQQAVLSEEAREQLRAKLGEMQTAIAEFNALEPPAIARSVHAQLVEASEAFRQKLNAYAERIQSGDWSFAGWSASGIAEAVAPLAELLDKLRQLPS